MMLKKEFQKIFNQQVKFHHKRFDGKDKKERREDYDLSLETYYESFGDLTIRELELAFKNCREHFEYFPKINQLRKFCPVKRKEEEEFNYEALPQSEESKIAMEKVLKGSSKFQLGEQTIRNNFALIAERWPKTDWKEAIEREIRIDKKRMKRSENA